MDSVQIQSERRVTAPPPNRRVVKRSGEQIRLAAAPVTGLARLRQGCYRLLSQAVLWPKEERLRGFALATIEMGKMGQRGHLADYLPEWDQLLGALGSFAARQPAALEKEYTRIVAGNAGPSLLYESSHLSGGPAAQGWLLAQLLKEYAEAGVISSPHGGETEDHAAVELEFMAYLCNGEAEAWEREDVAQALRSSARQGEFLSRHLAKFLPTLAQGVEVQARGGSYLPVLRAAANFVLSDADLVSALRERFRDWSDAYESATWGQART